LVTLSTAIALTGARPGSRIVAAMVFVVPSMT
jgi:hypothetical protein